MMHTLDITLNSDGWYTFVKRGVQYDLKEESEYGHWLVFTWRQSLPATSRGIKTLTIDEMKNGNTKVLKDFAEFILAEGSGSTN